jgi:hypothetical protein
MSAIPPPPPVHDIISMFNNLVSYLKSATLDDETTRKDIANGISSSEHLVTYLSNLQKRDDIEEDIKKETIREVVAPLMKVFTDVPAVVPQEIIHIGINEISREVGRTIYFKMTPQTTFQKVFSSFVKRLLFATDDEIEV